MGTREGWNDKHITKPVPMPCVPQPNRSSPNPSDSWDQHPASQHWASNTAWDLQLMFSFSRKPGSLFFPETITACTEWRELNTRGCTEQENMRGHSWECYFGDRGRSLATVPMTIFSSSPLWGALRETATGGFWGLCWNLDRERHYHHFCPLHLSWSGLSCMGQFLFSGFFCFLLPIAFLFYTLITTLPEEISKFTFEGVPFK